VGAERGLVSSPPTWDAAKRSVSVR
jgi:hypothetical protein